MKARQVVMDLRHAQDPEDEALDIVETLDDKGHAAHLGVLGFLANGRGDRDEARFVEGVLGDCAKYLGRAWHAELARSAMYLAEAERHRIDGKPASRALAARLALAAALDAQQGARDAGVIR